MLYYRIIVVRMTSEKSRITLIESIPVQVRYFALALLIVESLLGLLATKASGFDFTLLCISMVIIFFVALIMGGYFIIKKSGPLPNGSDNKNPANTDQFRRELLSDDMIKSIEHIARTNSDDYIRIACAHTVWSCRPDRAKPLLEDAEEDLAEVVRKHAEKILVKFYQN